MILPDFKDFSRTGRLLGIDWGARRVGTAISDERQEYVFTRPQIDVVKSGMSLVTQIMRMLDEEKIVGIVIGLPIRSDGSESETTKAVRMFAAKLATNTDLPILFVEENLTSMAAEEQLAGMRHDVMKKMLDSESAKVILENAIALLRRNG